MQKKLRVTAAVLAAALCTGTALAGCGQGTADFGSSAGSTAPAASTTAQNDAATPMGRWVESAPMEEVTGGKSIYALQAPTLLDDGSLVLYAFTMDEAENDRAPLTKYTSADDGATWQSEEVSWAPQDATCTALAMTPGGTVLAQVYENDAFTYTLYAPDGTATLLDCSAIEGFASISQAWFLSDTLLALVPGIYNTVTPAGNLWLYDLTSKQFTGPFDCGVSASVTGSQDAAGNPYSSSPVLGAAVCGGNLLFSRTGGGTTPTLSTVDSTGKVTNSEVALVDSTGYAAIGDAEGNYYYMSNSGIYRLASGGTLPEQVLSGSTFAIGLPSNYCRAVCRAANGDFLALVSGGAAFTLYRYHWDETLPALGSGEALTVWSLGDMATVRAAIVELGRANPDVSVEYTPALTRDTTTNFDDALRNLNTELLAGGGPDVLILDGIDTTPLLKNNLLLDLSGTVDTGALVQNVVGPYLTDGAAYILPARYRVPILWGAQGSTASLTSLDGLKAEILAGAARPDYDAKDDAYYTELAEGEKYALSMLDVDTLVSFALQTSANALVENNAVNADNVRTVLDFIGAVGGHYGMKDYRPASEHVLNGTGIGDDTDTYTIEDSGYEYGFANRAKYGWGWMETPAVLVEASRTDTPGEAVLQPGLVQGAFNPTCLTGVNAATTHKDQALAFVQALFGATVQDASQDNGLPVLQSAQDALLARTKDSVAKHCATDPAALLASVTTPVTVDATLRDAVLTHAQKLIDGEEDLDAATTGVQNDLALALAEGE